MMPVVQLDPASLTMWYNPELVHGGPYGKQIGEAVAQCIEGDDVAAVNTLRSVKDETARVHGISLISSVWHERRHFLDILLTNYGAFRLRQFILFYSNWHALDTLIKGKQPLVCPIDVYLDTVRCEVLGIKQGP